MVGLLFWLPCLVFFFVSGVLELCVVCLAVNLSSIRLDIFVPVLNLSFPMIYCSNAQGNFVRL